MNADVALAERRAVEAGSALAEIQQRVEKSRLGKVSREELRSLPADYRRAVAELAEARARGVRPERLEQIEAIVIHAHGILYAPERIHLGVALWQVLVSFPVAARRFAAAAALAASLLVAGGVWGWFEVRRDPTAAAVLLSGALQVNAESFQKGFSPREGDPVYGAFYFTNNARAALTAYALGATFGIGTVLILIYNGVILGATIAIVQAHGSLEALLSYVLPHSGVELTAIVLAAAAGLHLARALIEPGWLRRRDALALAARESLPLPVGSAVLLIVAGITEGWIAPMLLPLWIKATVGGTLDVLLVLYLLLPGRGAHRDPDGAAS
jgi:uncharacterized membrane protein SpoIIM required for sporulation